MDLLLKAAEFLDYRDTRSDHIYATTIAKHLKNKPSNKPYLTKSTHQLNPNRRVHNELEKSRRAKLKYSLESFKSIIPTLRTSNKYTQLKLLRAATDYIQLLKKENKVCLGSIRSLEEEQSHLKDKLKSLTFVYRVRSSSLSSDGSNKSIISYEEADASSRQDGSESDSDSFVEVS